MANNKIKVFKVAEITKRPPVRLIRGTLRQVENLLLSETDIAPATAEEAHGLRDVVIEDATTEPS